MAVHRSLGGYMGKGTRSFIKKKMVGAKTILISLVVLAVLGAFVWDGWRQYQQSQNDVVQTSHPK